MVLKELMRHASVTTTEKYYVGIQSDETSALFASLMVNTATEGERKQKTVKKVNGKVNEQKKGFPANRKPLKNQCERWDSNQGPTD